MERTPNHHDAEIVLKLYDLRREAVLRQHRAQMIKDFWPRSSAELLDILKNDHPLNTCYRHVSTYWDMVYSMARLGTVHPDVLMEMSGEGMFLYARIEPYLADLRAATNPRTFRNTEWAATQT